MTRLQQARIKLGNHFPLNLKFFWYKGLKIDMQMFYYG